MEKLIDFLTEIGKLKKMKRGGWILRKIKDPETIAEHTFRIAISAWILSKEKKMDIKKILKLALIHDLCEVYSGDITIYNNVVLPKDRKKRREIIEKWPRFSKKEKEKFYQEKYQQEYQALKKITSYLPLPLRKEIMNLWQEYEKKLTKEGRFVRQVDHIENLLQALEYKKKNKRTPIRSFWITAKEVVDDPLLVKFMDALDKKFHQKPKK